MWQSMRPGMRNRPPASICRIPTIGELLTELILPPAIPTLCDPGSTVEPSKILALLITSSHALSSLDCIFGPFPRILVDCISPWPSSRKPVGLGETCCEACCADELALLRAKSRPPGSPPDFSRNFSRATSRPFPRFLNQTSTPLPPAPPPRSRREPGGPARATERLRYESKVRLEGAVTQWPG